MRWTRLAVIWEIMLVVAVPCFGLETRNVAVVVNSASAMSEAVGRYYCDQAGIPPSNLIEVAALPTESIAQPDFAVLAQRIRAALISQLGVDPAHPETDPIQALVLCYGVPSKVVGQAGALTGEDVSVDSLLTLLFNRDPDLGPADIDGDSGWKYPGTMGVPNPYFMKDVDFATFRTSPDNDIAYTIGGQTHHWKMRYLVTRLDAYDDLTESVPGFGTIPRDVKRLIDRAHASAGQRGRFILDEPWNADGQYGQPCYDDRASELRSLLAPSLLVHDGEDAGDVPKQCMLVGYTDGTNNYSLSDSTGVMGYASFGMHDTDIWLQTWWGRPTFNWKPGAVALIAESFLASSVRSTGGAWFPSNAQVPNSAVEITGERKLRVIAKQARDPDLVKPYTGYRVAVFDANTSTELRATLVDSNGVAEMDFSTDPPQWPSNHKVVVTVFFPSDDGGYHDGRGLASYYSESSSEYDLVELLEGGDGLQLTLDIGRQRIGEYVRAGCSAASGAVYEPFLPNIMGPTLSRYAEGRTWAEAAYMGTNRLGYKLVHIGDPLMAPYMGPPFVHWQPPTPGPGLHIRGWIPLIVDAEAVSCKEIEKVELWVDGAQTSTCVCTDMSAPYSCFWES